MARNDNTQHPFDVLTSTVTPSITVPEDSKQFQENFDRCIRPIEDKILRNAELEIAKQIQIAQASYITVFGIFASITSFLTIEFQFLKVMSNINQIVGFTLVLWALLFAFNLGLDYLVTNRLEQNKVRPNVYLIAMVLVPLMIGLGFIVYGNMSCY